MSCAIIGGSGLGREVHVESSTRCLESVPTPPPPPCTLFGCCHHHPSRRAIFEEGHSPLLASCAAPTE